MNIAVIPARFGSTRFPGKPLALIKGRPMLWHVYQRAARAKLIDEVWVATDDERIYQAVKSWDGNVVMTRKDHPSGTDRVAEAISELSCEIVVNVQGDEPMIDPAIIDAVVDPLVRNKSLGIVTPITKICTKDDIFDPSVVKVVRDAEGFALYFSRAPIPYARDVKHFQPHLGDADEKKNRLELARHPYYRHIGLYAFHRETLSRFCSLPPSELENTERLEQLRALAYGIPIYTVVVEYFGVGVDYPRDLAVVERLLSDNGE